MESSNYANDNEPNSWRSIGWQAALIVNRLHCQAQLMNLNEEKSEQPSDEPETSRGDKKETNEHTAYVDQRLRELAAFERRARGLKDGSRG
jgi:hypothetical protein